MVLNPIYEDTLIPCPTENEVESDRKSNIFLKKLLPEKAQISELCGKFFDRGMDIKKKLQQKPDLKRQKSVCEEDQEEQVDESDLAEESKDEFATAAQNLEPYAIQFQFDEYGEEKEQQPPVQRHRLYMGDIGRSVSDSPNVGEKDGSGASKRLALTDIGRSFSVVTGDEEIVGIFVEGTSSCPNPSSLHASSTLSTGGPNAHNNAIAAISVPVSPIGKLQSLRHNHPTLESNSFRKSRKYLLRDSSFQSDSSHCSSVESLLEARKPDPEAILINLGFGPPRTEDILSKIPKR